MKKITLEYYKTGHYLMMSLVPIFLIILYIMLKNKNKQQSQKILFVVSLVNIAVFIIYKINIRFAYADYKMWEHLPIQMCNINALLLPIAIKRESKFLLGYLFNFGIIGAMIGIMSFDTYFLSSGVFTFSVLIYFAYHAMLIALPTACTACKLFVPRYKNILPSLCVALVLMFIAHATNIILIKTGVCEKANYFYTMGLHGNPLADVLMKIIPRPLLFLLPALPPLLAVQCLLAVPFEIKIKKCNKSQLQHNVAK